MLIPILVSVPGYLLVPENMAEFIFKIVDRVIDHLWVHRSLATLEQLQWHGLIAISDQCSWKEDLLRDAVLATKCDVGVLKSRSL